ncbi:MAG: hypothetical protein ACRCZ2_02560 [Fusobacteriaceae bacterium]
MSDGVDIPITTPGGAESAATLRSIAVAMQGLGTASQDAGAKASAVKSAFDFNQIVDATRTAYDAVTRLASGVAALASEQAQLDANSSRLGLNFDQAAEAAGRFTDETEAMTASTRLAEAGIRLNQEQLDSLTRVAARFAQNTGVTTRAAIDTLTQGLITGSERGLRPFGGELVRVAGESHTAEQRLAALTTQAGHTEQATDDAASSMERFADTIDDTKRTLATAFAQGITDTLELAAATDTAGNKFEILNEDIVTAGRTMGTVVVGIGNGIAAVAGGVATAIAAMISGIVAGAEAAGAVVDRLRSGQVLGLGGAASSAFRASVADSPITRALMDFTASRADAANRIADRGLAGDEGNVFGAREQRMADAATAAGMAAQDRALAGRTANARSAERGHVQNIAAALKAKNDAEEHAIREQERLLRERYRTELEGIDAVRRADLDALIERARASEEREKANSTEGRRAAMGQGRRETAAGQVAELADLRDPAAQQERLAEARRNHELDRERAHLTQRYEMQRSYVDRMEELHSTEADGTRALAEGVSGAFAGMGQAIAKHAQGLLDGKESVGEALQGMLSDTLASLAQQAVVKGAMETAEGIAALAGIVTAPLAPGHFAAAGAYFGVAALAGIGAAATAPSSGSAAASAPAPERESAARVSGSRGTASEGGGVVYNVNFGGPMYGTGGVRQAARQMVGAINRGGIQGGIQILPGALLGGGAGS